MGKKILIIDDSSTLITLLIELISKGVSDAEIITANNGKEGCKLAIKHQPNLILMDWAMPEMNGLQALSNLKRHDFTNDIPIIMMSSINSPEEIKLAFEAGAIYYLTKPFDEIELLAKVNAALVVSEKIYELKTQRNQLIVTNHKNDTILRSILPDPILLQIKQYGSVPPKRYKNKVVMFVDMVDFTKKSSSMSPGTLLRELQETFKEFDSVVKKHHCTRIKTIGDAYMAVCGMFDEVENVELEAVKAAIKIRDSITERNKTNRIKWEIKIGMYSGDIICSSVSKTNLSFDIFGETVNMASRLQQNCDPMHINVSKEMSDKLCPYYKLVERTARRVKGKGVIPMFYVHKPLSYITQYKRDTTFGSSPSFAFN